MQGKRRITRKNRCPHSLPIIRSIIKEWKAQTNGSVKRSPPGRYNCHYYLSVGDKDNTHSHVHLITQNYFDNTRCKRKTCFVPKNKKNGYSIKKKGAHCASRIIRPTSSAKQIVGQMRKSLKRNGCKPI